jgi:hypothetical protein
MAQGLIGKQMEKQSKIGCNLNCQSIFKNAFKGTLQDRSTIKIIRLLGVLK